LPEARAKGAGFYTAPMGFGSTHARRDLA